MINNIVIDGVKINVDNIKWQPHPAFPGVHMKYLLDSNVLSGHGSKAIVWIERGCSIGEHTHTNNIESLEFYSDSVRVLWEGESLEVNRGDLLLAKKGQKHAVFAENEDVYLIANFYPALF